MRDWGWTRTCIFKLTVISELSTKWNIYLNVSFVVKFLDSIELPFKTNRSETYLETKWKQKQKTIRFINEFAQRNASTQNSYFQTVIWTNTKTKHKEEMDIEIRRFISKNDIRIIRFVYQSVIKLHSVFTLLGHNTANFNTFRTHRIEASVQWRVSIKWTGCMSKRVYHMKKKSLQQ